MKVKFFEALYVGELENDINKWLDGLDINVVIDSQQLSTVNNSNHSAGCLSTVYTMSILYHYIRE
jgi:hypothetical protein